MFCTKGFIFVPFTISSYGIRLPYDATHWHTYCNAWYRLRYLKNTKRLRAIYVVILNGCLFCVFDVIAILQYGSKVPFFKQACFEIWSCISIQEQRKRGKSNFLLMVCAIFWLLRNLGTSLAVAIRVFRGSVMMPREQETKTERKGFHNARAHATCTSGGSCRVQPRVYMRSMLKQHIRAFHRIAT